MPAISAELTHNNPGLLSDFVTLLCDAKTSDMQLLLQEMNIRERLEIALKIVRRELVVVTLMQTMQKEVERDLQEHQRKYVLKEQLKKIKQVSTWINHNN